MADDRLCRTSLRRVLPGLSALTMTLAPTVLGQSAQPAVQPGIARFADPPLSIAATDCTPAKLGDAIPSGAIGEPVSNITLTEPKWVPAADSLPARCEVEGRIAPIDAAAPARPINFRIWLPAEWNRRAVQQGGGGMNGVIPDLQGAQYPIDGRSLAQWGFVTYGGDSGHQATFGRRGGPPGNGGPAGGERSGANVAMAQQGRAGADAASDAWALNDEASRNLGYQQLKKTRDAAMALVMRAYGERPRFTYFTGSSQGSREALTVAQRYPADCSSTLGLSERHDRIDACCTERWQVAGARTSSKKHDRGGRKGNRIDWTDSKKHGSERNRQSERRGNAEKQAHGDQLHAACDDEPEECPRRGSERHSHADLGPLCGDGVGHHAVQTHESQEQSDSTHERQENTSALTDVHFETRCLFQRLDRHDCAGIEALGNRLDCPEACVWIAAHSNVDDRIRRPLRVRVIHKRPRNFRQRYELRVGCNADDFRVRLVAAAYEAPERIHVREVPSGKCLVDDHHRWGARSIRPSELAAASKRDPECFEIARSDDVHECCQILV